MKTVKFILSIIACSFVLYTANAQAPEGITYQAEARDSKGKILDNKSLTIRTTILNGATSTTTVWSKEYAVKTDDYGLFSVTLGDAATETAFASINWGSGKYFLKTEILIGKNWTDMSTTQLLSVPYALYAKNAGNSSGLSQAEKDKLSGMQAGAEVNVQADWTQTDNTKDDYIKNKPAIPTQYTDAMADARVAAGITGKVDKVSGKGLSTEDYTTTERTKVANLSGVNTGDQDLSGLATLATVNDLIYQIKELKAREEAVLLTNGFTDMRDGTRYNVVKIGDQLWMKENLKYLPAVAGPATGSATVPYYYVYGYNGTVVADAKATGNFTTYGVLYNWPAAMAGSAGTTANPSKVQGICPSGWHLPSQSQWYQLFNYLDMACGGKLKETGTTHWQSPNEGATNESGFTGLPGGERIDTGTFSLMGYNGRWWSTAEADATNVWAPDLSYRTSTVLFINYKKESGFSVRCVRE